MENNLAFLGIAKKAGLLAEGMELAAAAAKGGRCRTVLSAADASEPSKRRAKRLAAEAGVRHIALRYTKRELGAALGKGEPGVIAITDVGIAAKFASYLPPDSFTEPPGPDGSAGGDARVRPGAEDGTARQRAGVMNCERWRAQ
jgi:ribosomal protein L7Ae-like RNA K-turn-binding protein